MRIETYRHALFLSALLLVAAIPASKAADAGNATHDAQSFGTIVGIVSDAAKRPVSGATVTALRAGGGIRSTISGSDGMYTFADVPAGS